MSTDDSAEFKNPPKVHQFRPGQSGNPRGRPKGTRNLRTDLTELLSGLVAVDAHGKKRRISRQQAVLWSLFARVEQGDVAAARTLLDQVHKLVPAEPQRQEISEEDKTVVADFLRCYRTHDDKGEVR